MQTLVSVGATAVLVASSLGCLFHLWAGIKAPSSVDGRAFASVALLCLSIAIASEAVWSAYNHEQWVTLPLVGGTLVVLWQRQRINKRRRELGELAW